MKRRTIWDYTPYHAKRVDWLLLRAIKYALEDYIAAHKPLP